jgi:heme exporter protein CcmD
MDHTPFILGSYAACAVVLTWTAVAPLLRLRRLKRELTERYRRQAVAETA